MLYRIKCLCFAFWSLFVLPNNGHALVAGIDSSGGLSVSVLEQTLQHWQPPTNHSGMAKILIRLSTQGRVLSCQAWRPGQSLAQTNTSTSAAPAAQTNVAAMQNDLALADSLCMAVSRAGSFAAPPSGLISELVLFASADGSGKSPLSIPVLSSASPNAPPTQETQYTVSESIHPENASTGLQNTKPITPINTTINSLNQKPNASDVIPASQGRLSADPHYADDVFQRVRSNIVLNGVYLDRAYTTVIRATIQPDGQLERVFVEKESGNAKMDEAVVRAFTKQGIIPKTPDGKPAEIVLTFTAKP